MSPRFTIVVPLFNKARFIRGALHSALAQTRRDLEVIVVDDGSTDEGAAIVEACTDPRVRLIRQANAGVSIARNQAIAAARGEWVVFLDADDWQHPRFLEALARVQDAHPGLDCVATRFHEFADDSGAPPAAWCVPQGEPAVELIPDLAARWMKGPTLFTGSIAIRHSLLRELQPCFRPGEHFGEDLDLWFRVSERTPIALIDVPLAGYRVGQQDSLSVVHRPRELPAWTGRLRERVNCEGFNPVRRRSALTLVAQMHVTEARVALVAGERGKAIAHWLRGAAAWTTPRWWLTAFMLAWPAEAVRAHQRPAPVAAPAPAPEPEESPASVWPPFAAAEH
ncbi:glycosyltransferase family 2 protein [Ramlibacter humi]|uniref:glycosyltransferase family 2 protein n=1 Tax=Ramlibacter humi TaxID=2530451 RepID=UPI001430EFED|nr:glycosyltransferase family 2 protein [Ramlibacter humi]